MKRHVLIKNVYITCSQKGKTYVFPTKHKIHKTYVQENHHHQIFNPDTKQLSSLPRSYSNLYMNEVCP